jgi:acyl-CoA reductase-like NAD-dependent aldehyde dehydrogenase
VSKAAAATCRFSNPWNQSRSPGPPASPSHLETDRVAELLQSPEQELAHIEARDGGGTMRKAMLADVPGAVASFEFFAGCAETESDE